MHGEPAAAADVGGITVVLARRLPAPNAAELDRSAAPRRLKMNADEPSVGPPLGRQKRVIGFAVALALLLFVLDAPFPKGYVPGALFVAVVGASLWVPGLRPIFVAASACTLLTVLGFFLSPPGPIGMDLFNRGFSIG